MQAAAGSASARPPVIADATVLHAPHPRPLSERDFPWERKEARRGFAMMAVTYA
jgi:hypothetical protein